VIETELSRDRQGLSDKVHLVLEFVRTVYVEPGREHWEKGRIERRRFECRGVCADGVTPSYGPPGLYGYSAQYSASRLAVDLGASFGFNLPFAAASDDRATIGCRWLISCWLIRLRLLASTPGSPGFRGNLRLV
jgi:hypothetical protein